MQNPTRTAPAKSTDNAASQPAKPLPAPLPLSPDLLQQIGGAGGPRSLPKGGW